MRKSISWYSIVNISTVGVKDLVPGRIRISESGKIPRIPRLFPEKTTLIFFAIYPNSFLKNRLIDVLTLSIRSGFPPIRNPQGGAPGMITSLEFMLNFTLFTNCHHFTSLLFTFPRITLLNSTKIPPIVYFVWLIIPPKIGLKLWIVLTAVDLYNFMSLGHAGQVSILLCSLLP